MNFRLVTIFAKLAKNYGRQVMHANDKQQSVQDLAAALTRQRHILTDEGMGSWMTAYEVLPVVLEVKLLTLNTARQFGISTKGKESIDVIEEITKAAAKSGDKKGAAKMRENLKWTRKLYAHPEIADILSKDMTDIDLPKSPRQIGTFFKQVASRASDEYTRVDQFLKKTKGFDPGA